jgi:hypothetical protein
MKTILALVWTHWLADFVMQTDSMAQKKSKSIAWLSFHIFVYMIPLLVFGWRFALVNGACHWVVDFFTSKINSRLWQAKKVHWFFVGVGVDQAIHISTLLLTAGLIR